jgi:prepilin-type N-terminal cleavage/methylation domain-containing protein
MKMLARNVAFTLVELLVVISIIAILASLALPAITGALVRGQMTQTLSNMKQLHLVTQQMAIDSTTTGDTNLGWPGDMPTPSWSAWATSIVANNYMATNDFVKMVSAPGITPSLTNYSGLMPGVKLGRAILLYGVSDTNTSDTVVISTSNFTNNTSGGTKPLANALPYGDKGYLVFRKGGDGSVLKANQSGSTFTNIIGASATNL